ncbi:MAG: DUF6884 domain-containing protein [Actinomycetes bacterium]
MVEVSAPVAHITSGVRRVGLVGCVKGKAPSRQAAKDLYRSTLFAHRRAYVETYCGSWWILSAKYGLVHPDDLIDPYDFSLNSVRTADRRAWSAHVLASLEDRAQLHVGDIVEIHAGSNYRDFGLMEGLQAKGLTVEVPTKGLGIGFQFQFYKQSSSQ